MTDDGRTRPLRVFLNEGDGRRPDVVVPVVAAGITYLAGVTGQGKTLHALEIALTKASGVSNVGYSAEPGPVLFVAADMAPDSYREYVRMLLDPGREGALDNFHITTPRGLYLDEEAGAADLREMIADVRAELCVIDHFGEVCTTDGITNSDLQPILNTFAAIRDIDGVSLLVLDQLRKEGTTSRRGSTAPAIDNLYGGRAKAAQADRVLMISRDAGSAVFTLVAVKERGPGFAPANFTFDAADGWQRDDSQHLHLTPGDKRVLAFIEAAAPELLRTRTEIEEGCSLKERAVYGSLARLQRYDLIVPGPKRGRSNTYKTATLHNPANRGASAAATNTAKTAHPYKGVQQSSWLHNPGLQDEQGAGHGPPHDALIARTP